MSAKLLNCVIVGQGPDLMVLHPAGLDHSFMGRLIEAAAATHRVIGVDLRGHADSPAASSQTTLSDFVDDVHSVVQAHCAGPARVLGLSFGGMLAQMLALDHPQDVSALVLCGCGSSFAPEVRPALRARGTLAVDQGMQAVLSSTIERWFNPTFRLDPQVDRVRERLLSNQPTNWAAVWNAISTLDALPRLGQLRLPALVVAGQEDVATPPAACATLAQAIDGAQLAVLPGAPHMMQIESPAAFESVVLAFLDSLPRSG
jgi:3-oxoadipate enol-lactonase